MNNFLKKIQSGNNEEKKRRLIILSVISMMVVVIIWIFYMNAVVFQNPNDTTTQEVKVDFWPAFSTGLSVTFDNIVSNIQGGISGIVSDVQKLK